MIAAVAQAAPSPVPAAPAPAPSAAPASSAAGNAEGVPPVAAIPSAQIAARARLVFEQIRADALDRSQFSSGMESKLDAHGLAAAAEHLRALGAVTSFNQSRRITHGTASLYVFRIVCEHPPVLEEAIEFAPDGKIDYLAFSPVTQAAPGPAPAAPQQAPVPQQAPTPHAP